MPAKTLVPPAARSQDTSRDYGDDGLFQRLARRLRDLLFMAVVGPSIGVLAMTALHFASSPQPPAAQRESDRVLAILEDRPTALPPGAARYAPAAPLPPPPPPAADFGSAQPTADVRQMADWVVARHDNGRMSFIVLDKRDARLWVFEPGGRLIDQTPVLLGSAHGDDTYPGIGDVPIAQVKPFQRTTAAGRFVTRPGLDADHTDVVWLDYDAALAMHRVVNKVKSERRLEHLAAADPRQRRISWGCINIPIAFFDAHISPVFGKRSGVTYVIPEQKTFAQVFEQGEGGAPGVATASAQALAPRDVAQR